MSFIRYKKFVIFLLTVCLVTAVVFPISALGDDEKNFSTNVTDKLKWSGGPTYNTNVDLVSWVAQVIRLIISTLGVIFFIFIIYGGWMWMSARGNEEQITKAKDIIRNSLIGLAIVMLSGLISFMIYYTVLFGGMVVIK